jgi:hypothetical protein
MIGKNLEEFARAIKIVISILLITTFLLLGFIFIGNNEKDLDNKEIIKTETIIKDGDTTITNYYK